LRSKSKGSDYMLAQIKPIDDKKSDYTSPRKDNNTIV
jgi:hypothetical protein